jgi:Tol biopolymer transport system component
MRIRVSVGLVLLACVAATAQAPPQQIFFSRVFPVPKEIGLFMANADGSDEHQLPGTTDVDYDPAWSPDGGWIAFTSERNGSADLYRMKPDGTSIERLTDSPAYDDQAAFSGDGQQIVFVTTRANGTADLWTLDVRTHAAKALTSGPGGDYRPSWSPDGSWIAFTSDRGTGLPFSRGRWEALQRTEIYLVHPDGSGLRQLTKRGEFCGSPKWSADSRRVVAYCTTAQETMDFRQAVPEGGSTSLVSIDVASGAMSDLASGPGVKMAPAFVGNDVGYIRKDKPSGIAYASGKSGPQGYVLGAAWSPDGRRVAYHKVVDPPTPETTIGPKIWSRLPSYDLRLGGMQPSFDPSGARYASADYVPTPEGNHLFVVDAETQKVTTIYHDPTRSVLGPQWSAKGDAIVFGIGPFGAFFNGFHNLFLGKADRVDGGAQMAMVKPDGTGFRELTKGPNNNGFPSLAPDSARVVYRTFGPDGDGLRIMTLSTGAVTTLTTGYDNFPLWSPRGDLIMFSRVVEGDYEVFTIRPDGTDVRRLTSTPGNDAHMAWSADGEHIVFTSSRMGFKDEVMYTDAPQPYGELFVMRYDGSDVQQLTDNQWEDGTPAWRPMPGRRPQTARH